jgi:hypothetical protein
LSASRIKDVSRNCSRYVTRLISAAALAFMCFPCDQLAAVDVDYDIEIKSIPRTALGK